MRKLYTSLKMALCLSVVSVNAQNVLDNTFGTNGKLNFSFGTNQWIRDIAVQPDGKIVVVGDYYFNSPSNRIFIKRLMPDGSPDPTFGNNEGVDPTSGYMSAVIFNYGAKTSVGSVLVLPDGKIMVTGNTSDQGGNSGDYDFLIAKFNADGTFDTTFYDEGIYTADLPGFQSAGSMTLQGDKILISGNFGTSGLTRFNMDGSVDTTFGNNGTAAGVGGRLMMMTDGSFYTAYYSTSAFGLRKYTADGILDTSFGNQGLKAVSVGTTWWWASMGYATLTPDGTIYLTGQYAPTSASGYYGLTVAFDLQGNLLTNFANGGMLVKEPQTWSARGEGIMLNNNKVTVAYTTGLATNYDYTVASYNMDGTPFTDFGSNGEYTFYFGAVNQHDYLEAVTVQPDGKMLMGGRSADGASLARLNPVNQEISGTEDFTAESISVYPNPAKDFVNIRINTDVQSLSVRMYNMLGMEVYKDVYLTNQGTINVQGLQEGLYFVELTQGTQKIIKKVMIK